MRFLLLFFLAVSNLAFAKSEPCEAELATLLTRGPIQLDVIQSQLRWDGEDSLTHEIPLAPRYVRALRAIFVAGSKFKEDQRIPHKDWVATYAQLYPALPVKPATIQALISEINGEIEAADPGMTYRLLTGRYRDLLEFSWGENKITVSEEEFTFLTKLKEKPNETITYADLLDEAIRLSGRWKQLANPQSRVNQVIRKLMRTHAALPIDVVHHTGFRWRDVEKSEIWKFRDFDLDLTLSRLRWAEGDQRFEIRLSPIELAVTKERFRHGEAGISWTKLAAAPTEERLKIASLTAHRVAFTKVRNKIKSLSQAAADRFTSR